jgi:hypothetical protein
MALAITEDGRTFFVPDEDLKMEITPEMLKSKDTSGGAGEVKAYFRQFSVGPFRKGTTLHNLAERVHDGARAVHKAAVDFNNRGYFGK